MLVVRYANGFLKRKGEEIAKLKRTPLSVRKTSLTSFLEHYTEPTWFAENTCIFRKKQSTRPHRKIHKRGAKINNDGHEFISDCPTNWRIYKLCNRYGFCLQLQYDSTVDGIKD